MTPQAPTDTVAIEVVNDQTVVAARDRSRGDALESLDALARRLPAGWSFSRQDANERIRA